MQEYERTACVCGKEARVVVCGVGCYIRCLWCGRSTVMCTTKEDARKEWEVAPVQQKG